MLTADFQDILEAAAGYCGLDRDNLAPDEFRDLRNVANNRLRYAWGYREWVDLERTQQRYFRAFYDSGTAYAAPTATTAVEVYDPATQLYYQTLQATTGNAPSIAGVENSAYWAVCAQSYSADDWDATVTYAAGDQVRSLVDGRYYQATGASLNVQPGDGVGWEDYWGILTEFRRYVAYEQTGQTAIGDVLRVTRHDPEVRADAGDVDSFITASGLTITEDLPYVYVQFRVREPRLVGNAWSNATSYAVGRQIYFASATTRGNFYDCISAATAGQSPETHASKWQIVEIPRRLQAFVENGAAADWLNADERPQPASVYGALAENFLYAEVIRHENQTQQRTVVRTR